MAQPLSIRSLNRATLDRQLLLRRSGLTVSQALERLVGLQAQTPHTWYVGLWTRLIDYAPDQTSQLLHEGGVVRMALMRSTIHLVTAQDCLWLRPLVEPAIERSTQGSFGREMADLDREALTGAARELLADKALTFSALGRALSSRWPDRDPAALAQAARAWMPLVQVPPRGVWGRSGQAAHVPVENWIGRGVHTDASLADLVLRYLAAFGPATVRDVQQWSGLTRLAEIIDRLRPQLAVFHDELGRELFDLPDVSRPHPDTPAPVRFLYDFDNLLLSHADRSRVSNVDYTTQGFYTGSMEQPRSVLVDGFVTATWKLGATRATATLTIRPFRALTSAESTDLTAEGGRLLSFLAAKIPAHDVIIERPRAGA